MNNHDVKPETMQAIAFGNLSNSHIHAQFHMIRSLCTIVFYHIPSYDIIYLLHHTCASDLFTYLQTAFLPSSNPALPNPTIPGIHWMQLWPCSFRVLPGQLPGGVRSQNSRIIVEPHKMFHRAQTEKSSTEPSNQNSNHYIQKLLL